MATQYNPTSHFFTVESSLLNTIDGSPLMATDAFGPVSGSLTTKYRVTSVVRSSTPQTVAKVFSICKGRILIQPTTGDSSKVNIILKPEGNVYSQIKIKYFIYRGVNKADLITSSDLIVPKNPSNNAQPKVVQNVWDSYLAINNSLPTSLPAAKLGFDLEHQEASTLIETYFSKSSGDGLNYQLPMCQFGEHIANFKGFMGLDVVLDLGDYKLEHQEQLFKLDLTYARKPEHIFDINDISATPVKIKRYREYISQFVDAAAFWGSHMKCGKIKLSSGTILTDSQIYDNILKKFQTKNNLYIYVNSENGRSYNYYAQDRKIRSLLFPEQVNGTSEWPILINTNGVFPGSTEPNPNNVFNDEITILDFNSTTRSIAVNVFAPNSDLTIYPLVEKLDSNAESSSIKIELQTNGLKTCASLIKISCRIQQESSLSHYYDYLWPANVKSNFKLLPDESGSATHFRGTISDFSSVIGEWAQIQNKVFFDIGKNTANSSKRRILFIASISGTTNRELVELNVDNIVAIKEKNIGDNKEYLRNVYNDVEFSVFRGLFNDGTESISFLNLFHEKRLDKKNRYFHLGITEEEYNILIFDNILPGDPTNQRLPFDSDNVFFHLEKDTSFPSSSLISKFKLGLNYEDSSGIITSLPASSLGNDLYVFTCDGLYFFSKAYSEFQNFSISFPKTRVDFQIKQPYNGEFGFDWMRDGTIRNPTMLGDISYKNSVGKLYKISNPSVEEDDGNEYKGVFGAVLEEYKRLEFEYKSYFVQYESNVIEKYFIPMLAIFPPYVAGTVIDLDKQNVFENSYPINLNRVAKLRLKIFNVTQPLRLELDYDHTIFNVIADPISTSSGTRYADVTLNCLREFGSEQLIKVIAFYSTEPNKGVIVGLLRVMPNAQQKRFSKKTVFVTVTTSMDNVATFPIKKLAQDLTMFLRQALTSPIFKTENINMITVPDPTFMSKYIHADPININNKSILESNDQIPITPDKSAMSYLNNKLKLQNQQGTTVPIGDMYDEYFKVFIFRMPGVSIKVDGTISNLGGISNGFSLLSYYNSAGISTIAHEFLHTAGLSHSFTNYNKQKSPSAIYTYFPLKTDNIMDYSEEFGIPKKPTISIFDWQIKIVQEKFDPEP